MTMIMNKRLKKIISDIAAEIIRERSGGPVLLADLQKKFPEISRRDFDLAILTMEKSGGYFLSKDFHPGCRTDTEKADWVPDGSGNCYFAINPRGGDAGIFARFELHERKKRGGYREGAGRPAVKMKLKKEQMATRLSGWIVEWLKSQPDKSADLIETALIEKYGLTPPENKG
jgi:hypothetical protein